MSATQQKKKWDNSELMRAAGSTSGRFDPESPDHWLYVLLNGPPEERALAWVKSKTTAMSRGPFCADQHGKPLYIESLAAALGWKERTARNVLAALESQGRVRVDKKRIWYRADVPASVRRTEGEETDFVQSHWPPYVLEKVKNLPEVKQAQFKAETAELKSFEAVSFKELVAGHRAIIERVQDSMLLAYGIEKKRIKKRRDPSVTYAQLSLLAVPEFVQSHAPEVVAEFVRTGNGASYKPENGSVRSQTAGVSLLRSDTDTDLRESVGQSEQPGQSDRPTEAAIAKLLHEELEHLHQTPRPKLLADIRAALSGAPLSYLRTRIRGKLQQNAAIFKSIGLTLALAAEVGEAWQRGEPDRQRQAKRDAEVAEGQAALNRKMAAETLADPSASDAEKQHARELLSEQSKGAAS